jgi:hypothetical protein
VQPQVDRLHYSVLLMQRFSISGMKSAQRYQKKSAKALCRFVDAGMVRLREYAILPSFNN